MWEPSGGARSKHCVCFCIGWACTSVNITYGNYKIGRIIIFHLTGTIYWTFLIIFHDKKNNVQTGRFFSFYFIIENIKSIHLNPLIHILTVEYELMIALHSCQSQHFQLWRFILHVTTISRKIFTRIMKLPSKHLLVTFHCPFYQWAERPVITSIFFFIFMKSSFFVTWSGLLKATWNYKALRKGFEVQLKWFSPGPKIWLYKRLHEERAHFSEVCLSLLQFTFNELPLYLLPCDGREFQLGGRNHQSDWRNNIDEDFSVENYRQKRIATNNIIEVTCF